jgi:poly(hydroxyalkanoate) depolymerase family esterase
MSPFPTDAMTEAARLTREGRLAEASALIQRTLQSPRPAAPRPAPPAAAGRRIIDIDPVTGAPTAEELARGRRPAAPSAGMKDTLRNLLGRVAPRRPRQVPDAPEPAAPGGRFLTKTFTSEVGRRDYRLYIPASLAEDARPPLLVMLHGCTQSPEDFAAGTRMNLLAEAHGLLVAYPAQPQSANAQRCWNWFNPADQRRDAGEPALIAGITREILRDHAADPQRVYAAGLSAGGAQAAIMGVVYPDLYAAIGVHSGLACGAARDVPSAFAAMRQGGHAPAAGGARIMPTIVFHADRDTTVHPVNGDQVIAQSGTTRLCSTVEHGEVPGGHAWSRTIHRDAEGHILSEQWLVKGAGHAWSGGSPAGSYTDPRGPDASREMLRFFLGHRRR